MNSPETPKIRITQRGPSSIHIEGLSKTEHDQIVAAIESGAGFVSVKEGRLVFHKKFEDLPDPIKDTEMLPFWSKWDAHKQEVQGSFFKKHEHSIEIGYSPSITISYLCGYYYSEKAYKKYAERLESYGFYQMRSKRFEDGKFLELWYLPNLFAAKEDLKTVIKSASDQKDELAHALEFLRAKIQFGSLDVSSQRMAMVISD